MKHTLLLTIILLNIHFTAQLNAQIELSNLYKLSKLHAQRTYFILPPYDQEERTAYMNGIKKNWTMNEPVFIEPSQVKEHLKPGNIFFGITVLRNTVTYQDGSIKEFTYLFFDLWSYSSASIQRILKRSEKLGKFEFPEIDIREKDRIRFARMELSPSLFESHRYIRFEPDNKKPRIHNWGPGILKNQIQAIMAGVRSGKQTLLFDKIYEEKSLKRLRSDTLFIPAYVLYGLMPGFGQSGTIDTTKLLRNYQLPHQFLEMDALNDKILSDTNGFLYLLYIKNDDVKYICVVNSLTGEMIYRENDKSTSILESSDFKKLYKKIK